MGFRPPPLMINGEGKFYCTFGEREREKVGIGSLPLVARNPIGAKKTTNSQQFISLAITSQ